MATIKTAFRNRSLLILVAAETVSAVGNWISTVAIYSLLIFRGGGGVSQTSGFLLAALVPLLLCSPVAGWLCDRFDRRGLMIGSELLSGLAVAGLILTTRLPLIYLLVAVQSAVGAVMTPARRTVVPLLVDPADLSRVNAVLQQLAGLVKIGAPVLAGGLLALVSPRQAMVLDVISFAVSAAVLSLLPPLRGRQAVAVRQDRPGRSPTSVLREVPLLRLMVPIHFLFAFVIISLEAAMPALVRDVLRGREGQFGLQVGLVGLGTMAGALVLMVRRGKPDLLRETLLGALLLVAFPAGAGLAVWAGGTLVGHAALMAGALVGGVGSGVTAVQATTLV
ncbi:MAG TPA: MFS transporter [Symbiobacteriaceae bacterium]|jgi:MFS family permease